ncbi:SRPBCC family protein [Streptomyces sp. CRN 30]|uniref:SRPBCC family protein n=1 Tax=Streptomyces sp. CRN 30 TaxID=3075613 RepID=UPI002A80A22E|nr:SRPBCC family protein [Streptomyces sp. CRN 30]
MAVLNVHERPLPASPDEVGALLDALGSPGDRLWPPGWPAVRFEGPLAVGVPGGHGPVRYVVSDYVPGRWVRFRFTGPRGFEGFHEFGVEALGDRRTVLRHTLVVSPRGPLWPLWPLFVRPLHDAVFRQCLDRAEHALTGTVTRPARWSLYARVLRVCAARLTPKN